jgi:hypothetical protein
MATYEAARALNLKTFLVSTSKQTLSDYYADHVAEDKLG